MTFSQFARAGPNLWSFWRVFVFTPPSRFGFDSGRCQKSVCGCGADAFSEVFRCSFVDCVFVNLKRDLLKIPSLLFVFCSFLHFLLQLGSTQPCMCVLGQLALNLSFLFVFLFVCLQKHCFPLNKGYFCSFLNVSTSFSLVSFTSSFHSLSLSLFPLFICFVLPCSFVYFCDLSCFFAVLSCLVSLLLFHDNNNIKILDVKGFFSSICSVSFGFPVFWSFQSLSLISVFHCLSSVF